MATDLSSLLAAGLSQEEAELIMARRQAKPVAPVGTRLAVALLALAEAVRKTGVAPVRVAGDVLEKSEPQDPEALERFYSTKGGSIPTLPKPPTRWQKTVVAVEDQSQDPEDY